MPTPDHKKLRFLRPVRLALGFTPINSLNSGAKVLYATKSVKGNNAIKINNTTMPPTSTPHQYLIDFINLYGNITSVIVSIVLGVLSIWLSVVFYRSAKASEVETAKLLQSIENNVSTLNVINNDLLSKAIHHLASSNNRMIEVISQYNQNIENAAHLGNKNSESSDTNKIRRDILATITYITALTGNTVSIQIFEELKQSYSFQAILFELIQMKSENIITWDGNETKPAATSSIKLIPRKNKSA